MIHIVVKASALGISRVEAGPTGRRHLSNFFGETLIVVIVVGDMLLRMHSLEFGKVIGRHLGRQELLLIDIWRGTVVLTLFARCDGRRAVHPGPLRAGVERMAKFL